MFERTDPFKNFSLARPAPTRPGSLSFGLACAVLGSVCGMPLAAYAQSPSPARPAAAAAPASAIPAPAASAPAAASATAASDSGVRVLLTPEMETVLLAQMVGRITALNASLGSRVRAGQVVVSFDCSEHAARLKMSEAELASARETYNNKARLKGLDAAGDVEVALAAAQVDRANGQIEMTRVQIQSCTVKAPFAGSISKLHVKPHQGVTAGQQLVEMIGDGPPKVRLNVPSRWLRKLKVGSGFTMNIEETGGSYKASVSAINTRVDPIAQTIEIEGRVVGKATGLLPGMSGLAQFGNLR